MATSTIAEAEAAVKAKQYDEALRIYNEASTHCLVQDRQSKDPSLLADRAHVHYRLKDNQQALADVALALELDSRNALAHHVQGQALFAEGDFRSALQAFEKLVVLEPAKRVYKQWVAMCRVRLGEKPEPAEEAEAASAGPSPVGSHPGPAPPPSKPRAATIDDAEYCKYWRSRGAPSGSETGDGAGPSQAQPAYRHQWFQTAAKVEVGVLAKGLRPEQVAVHIAERRLRVCIRDVPGNPAFELTLRLAGPVLPTESTWSLLGSKVEVILIKADALQWPDLAEAPAATVGAGPAETVDATGGPSDAPPLSTPVYPYAGKKVDWDAVEAAVKAEEKQEQPEGEAGVMKFFQELYQSGDEDFKRAMMKSYVESGGVELSTEWKEVAKKDFKASRNRR